VSEAPSRRHPTAGEYIVENLRNDILTARLAAGEPLLLDQLAERFGTSVIPIREALRVLEAERLVVLRPHRTAQVAELSLAELKDLYRVRLLLDVEAARLAHGNFTAAELAELRDLIDSMERYALDGDDLTAFAIHTNIHFRIYEAAGSPVLLEILERLWDETERYRHAVKHYRSDPASWGEEHRRLVDLLERGSPKEAADEMRAHLTRTLDALTKARVFETTNGASEAEEGEPAATARRTRRRPA
jgi:DNA-binding GntR family transcriptional regulator